MYIYYVSSILKFSCSTITILLYFFSNYTSKLVLYKVFLPNAFPCNFKHFFFKYSHFSSLHFCINASQCSKLLVFSILIFSSFLKSYCSEYLFSIYIHIFSFLFMNQNYIFLDTQIPYLKF